MYSQLARISTQKSRKYGESWRLPMYPKIASFALSITEMPGAKSPFEDASAEVDQSSVNWRCRESKHWPFCCIVRRLPANDCRTEKCRQLRSVTEKAEHSVTMPAAESRKVFILDLCRQETPGFWLSANGIFLYWQRLRSYHSNCVNGLEGWCVSNLAQTILVAFVSISALWEM